MSQSSKLVTLANRLTALEKTAYPFGHGGPPRHVEDYEADPAKMAAKAKEALKLVERARVLVGEASSGGGEYTGNYADGMDRRTMTAFDKAEITLPECIGDIKALVRAL